MHKLFLTALNAYTLVFKIHASNKGTDPTHHSFTESVYEDLFTMVHTIAEKLSDTGHPLMVESNKDFRKEVYESIKGLKITINDYIIHNNESIGTDNALRGIADKLEFMCNNAKSYIVELE